MQAKSEVISNTKEMIVDKTFGILMVFFIPLSVLSIIRSISIGILLS